MVDLVKKLKLLHNSSSNYQNRSYFSHINIVLPTQRLAFFISDLCFRSEKFVVINIPLIYKDNLISKLPNLLNEKSHYFLVLC